MLVEIQEYHLAWQASLGNQLLLPSAFIDEKTETNLHPLWIQSLGVTERGSL